VLTAAHVVAGAVRVQVRNPDKRLYPATTEARFIGEGDGPAPDLALVEIDDPEIRIELPACLPSPSSSKLDSVGNLGIRLTAVTPGASLAEI
jgi:S1-C subfamily serine protease